MVLVVKQSACSYSVLHIAAREAGRQATDKTWLILAWMIWLSQSINWCRQYRTTTRRGNEMKSCKTISFLLFSAFLKISLFLLLLLLFKAFCDRVYVALFFLSWIISQWSQAVCLVVFSLHCRSCSNFPRDCRCRLREYFLAVFFFSICFAFHRLKSHFQIHYRIKHKWYKAYAIDQWHIVYVGLFLFFFISQWVECARI